MGASSSIEQREVESIAASSEVLPTLQKAFSTLADPNSNEIPQRHLWQRFNSFYDLVICDATLFTEDSVSLAAFLGFSMADLFFVPGKRGVSMVVDLFFVPRDRGVNWVEFVKGYNKCCGRMSSSMSLNTLLRVFFATQKIAGVLSNLEFKSDDADCEINGFLLPVDVFMLLWLSWTMLWESHNSKFTIRRDYLCLPDVNHLLLSALTFCADEVCSGLNVWDCNILGLDVQLPVEKFRAWALKTLPTLPDCLPQFLHARIHSSHFPEDLKDVSKFRAGCLTCERDPILLTRGNAWAIYLTMRSTISEELSKAFLYGNTDEADENILYRSSLHGRGLNRFWSHVEGYQGPLLVLISATLDGTIGRKWIIGALTKQGFENRDVFYGSSGNLYSISPIFHSYSATGKEKNFVYSHLRPSEAHTITKAVPVGIGFGGSVGNERLFIDEDFVGVTVRHHAVDNTYHPGFLFPYHEDEAVKALIIEVGVWGLGGKAAKEVQDNKKYMKKENTRAFHSSKMESNII